MRHLTLFRCDKWGLDTNLTLLTALTKLNSLDLTVILNNVTWSLPAEGMACLPQVGDSMTQVTFVSKGVTSSLPTAGRWFNDVSHFCIEMHNADTKSFLCIFEKRIAMVLPTFP